MRLNLLAIFAAIAVALFLGAYGEAPKTGGVGAATTTLSVLPSVAVPPLALPSLAPTSTPATASSKATSTPPAAPKAAKPAPSAPAQPPVSAPAPAPAPGDLAAAAATLRTALVNIICYVPAGSSYKSISGSGVIISSSGYVLTNAHVAQYFLLANQGVSCELRTGSPASDAYHAALAFISPAWISANPNVIHEENPTGDGEHDFALLAITRSSTGTSLPSSFPFVPLSTAPPLTSDPVVIGSYAAQFLGTAAIESALYPTLVYGSIKNVYTFDTNTIDVVSLGGSAAAQEGSSGGGVVNAQGEFSALISTTTIAPSTADRDLQAITLSYIRREYAAESGASLPSLLSQAPASAVSSFAPQIPALEALITANS